MYKNENLVERLEKLNPEVKTDVALMYKYARYDNKEKFVEKLQKLLTLARSVGVTDAILQLKRGRDI